MVTIPEYKLESVEVYPSNEKNPEWSDYWFVRVTLDFEGNHRIGELTEDTRVKAEELKVKIEKDKRYLHTIAKRIVIN